LRSTGFFVLSHVALPIENISVTRKDTNNASALIVEEAAFAFTSIYDGEKW